MALVTAQNTTEGWRQLSKQMKKSLVQLDSIIASVQQLERDASQELPSGTSWPIDVAANYIQRGELKAIMDDVVDAAAVVTNGDTYKYLIKPGRPKGLTTIGMDIVSNKITLFDLNQSGAFAGVTAADVLEVKLWDPTMGGLYIPSTNLVVNSASTHIIEMTANLEEHITDGDMSSNVNWTEGTGWVVAAGVATATGAINTNLAQLRAAMAKQLVPNVSYWLTYDITWTIGAVVPSYGRWTGVSRSATGSYSEELIFTAEDCVDQGSTGIFFFDATGFTGTIDNVSIKLNTSLPFTKFEIMLKQKNF